MRNASSQSVVGSACTFVTMLVMVAIPFGLSTQHAGLRCDEPHHPTNILRTPPTYSPFSIVSFYFRLGAQSKHSEGEYRKWFSNFLHIDGPLILLTDGSYLDLIHTLREPRHTLVCHINSTAALPPVRRYSQYFHSQHAMDPEKQLYFPETYAVYQSKVWFLRFASALNPFSSRYFFWVDSGSFRNQLFMSWPDMTDLLPQLDLHPGRILLSNVGATKIHVHNASTGPYYPKASNGEDMIQAGFFGGDYESIQWFANDYYAHLVFYTRAQQFVMIEQVLLSTLAIRNYWRTLLIEPLDIVPSCTADRWFAFQRALSRNNTNCRLQVKRIVGTINVQVVA